jgi:hypothetical protein
MNIRPNAIDYMVADAAYSRCILRLSFTNPSPAFGMKEDVDTIALSLERAGSNTPYACRTGLDLVTRDAYIEMSRDTDRPIVPVKEMAAELRGYTSKAAMPRESTMAWLREMQEWVECQIQNELKRA